jgi:protein-L-isoaspartate(D-aspartate) O-methyltransferase
MSRQWTDLVDRRLFVPGTVYVQREELGDLLPVNREQEPEFWDKLVLSDEPVVTQLDSDGWPSSSSSARWVMNAMLANLDLHRGQRVLEIGTGTGWNAALMAAAGAIVTTVEIDNDLAAHARKALAQAGFADVVVIAGDGELGVPSRAPYERVICTAAAHSVPYEWVVQTVDGGVIVLPYTGVHHPRGLAVLTVSGQQASGRIVDEAAFMPLRGQKINHRRLREIGEPKQGVALVVRADGQIVTFDGAL